MVSRSLSLGDHVPTHARCDDNGQLDLRLREIEPDQPGNGGTGRRGAGVPVAVEEGHDAEAALGDCPIRSAEDRIVGGLEGIRRLIEVDRILRPAERINDGPAPPL